MLMCGAAVEVARNKEQQAIPRGVTYSATSNVKSRCWPLHTDAPLASTAGKKVETPVEGRAWQAAREMPPSQHPARINLHDLKAQILKKIGPEKASQYFSHFKSFLSYKLKKSELDRLVISTIGKENVSLHNQLIRAVLSNAIRGQVPPPPSLAQHISKPVKGIRRKPIIQSFANGSTSPQNSASPAPPYALSNGDSFTLCLRKGRSGIRDRKANKETPNLLGSYGKEKIKVLQGTTEDDTGPRRGDFRSPDLCRPLQESQSADEPDAGPNSLSIPSAKRLRILPCSETITVESKEAAELLSKEYEKEVGKEDDGKVLQQVDRSVSAPLGLPFCPCSVGYAHMPPFIALPPPLIQLLHVDGGVGESLYANDLPDVETVKSRMDQIIALENLHGVTKECADLICQALDIWLKRVIKSSVNLVGTKYSHEQSQFSGKDSGMRLQKETLQDTLSSAKLHPGLNGVSTSNCFRASGTQDAAQVDLKERQYPYHTISLLDFKVAMDLNPQQLGEDWPLQLEKISFRLFDQ